VADHGLNVDADLADEDVIGIEHNAKAGEDGVGGEKRHEAVMDLSLSEDSCEKADVHGHGAELPGEDVPLEVPNKTIAFNDKAVNKHLKDFQKDDDHTRDKDGAADASVVAFFVRDAQKNACKDRQRKKHQVEPAVIGGAGHFRFANLL
jgi:hypothetical protein